MEGHLLYIICTQCGGDGKMPRTVYDENGNPSPSEADCAVCNGNKYILWGYATKDNQPIPDDLPIPET